MAQSPQSNPRFSRSRILLPLLLAVALGARLRPATAGTTETFIGPANGLWSAPANWSGGIVPNNSTSQTFDIFMNDPAAPSAQLDLSVTIDALTIDAGHSLNILAGNTLTLARPSLFNAGTLTVNALPAVPIGHLTFQTDASLSGGGVIQLLGGIISVGTPARVTSDNLISGFGAINAGGTWTGTGITSSTAAANVDHYAVGLFDDGVMGLTTFGGQVVGENSILLSVARYGDTNLDDIVDIQDLGNLANNWQQPATAWSRGDFNMDGLVDIEDLGILASNWQQTSQSSLLPNTQFPLPNTQTTPVPEPASLALICLALPLLARRSPRQSRQSTSRHIC